MALPQGPGWYWYQDSDYNGPVDVQPDATGLLAVARVCYGPAGPAPWPISQPVNTVPGQWLPIVPLPM